MITMVRTADVHDGKGTTALMWAVKVATHITKIYAAATCR